MGKVITSASMSLDGFIAGRAETGFKHLFAWHRNGDVEVPSADPRWSFNVAPASAGSGTRLVGDLSKTPVRLGAPSVRESAGVTHIQYTVDH